MSLMRINKFLAACGVASRRGADALIEQGRVTVNGEKVSRLGLTVDPEQDEIAVDGALVRPPAEKTYILMHKPAGVVSTLSDPEGRRTVVDLLRGLGVRVSPVGRLDYDTQGILLLTDDGDLAHRLTHPRFGVAKLYEAEVEGRFSDKARHMLDRGVRLEDGAVGRAEVVEVKILEGFSRIRLRLTEGRKREVKQLCAGVGHPVRRLLRLEFAGLDAVGVKPGRWRHLTAEERDSLRRLVGLP